MPDEPTTAAERAFAARLRPGERFSHLSAARIWGMPVPWNDGVVHISAPDGLNRIRRQGVVGHRWMGPFVLHSGLPVSPPIDVFVELAGSIQGDSLVAVGDWLVAVPRFPRRGELRPFCTPESLRTALAQVRRKGVAAARQAAALVRSGVESPRETMLRLLLVRAGLPEPACGLPVSDDRGRIGWFDLVWPAFKVAAEYDGDQHRTDSAQYDKDIARFDRASAAGWRVVRVRSSGLTPAGRAETVDRVRSALAARGLAADGRKGQNSGH